VAHQPAEEQVVQEPLLDAIGEARELGEILQDRGGVEEVVLRHADEVGGAVGDVVRRAHPAHE
jgi:hypothetical protein